MQIVFTPEASHLNRDIKTADQLRKHPNNKSYSFSDGEAYMNYDTSKIDEKILLVHSGYPDPNSGLKRVYSFLEKCKATNTPVQLFFTYFPFQRQDEIFRDGEIDEVQHIIDKLIEYYRVEEIYTVDPHFDELDYEVSAFNPIDEGVLESLLFDDEIFLIGCDEGAAGRYDIPSLDKIRENEDEVSVSAHDYKEEIEDSHVILIDDMIASGNTMRKCVEEVTVYRPEKISVYSTHFLENRSDPVSISKIKLISNNFMTTNSIDNSKVNIGYDVREKIIDIATMDGDIDE